jgi:hypothetical protein
MTEGLPHVDLLKAIVESRQIPPTPDGGPGNLVELPPKLGGIPVEETPVSNAVADPNKMAIQVRVLHFSKTFVIWKPYESCPRCQAEFKRDSTILPDVGDYTCPHVQTTQYKEAMDKCLAGLGNLLHREHFMLPDGRRCVLMEWGETDPEFLKEQEAKAAEAKKNSIAPTYDTGDD